jgi:hypothetical protein
MYFGFSRTLTKSKRLGIEFFIRRRNVNKKDKLGTSRGQKEGPPCGLASMMHGGAHISL